MNRQSIYLIMYTISKQSHQSVLHLRTVQPFQSAFERQEVFAKEIIKKIDAKVVAFIAESYNDAKTEDERQGILEAAQELGYYDLAINLML